MDSSSINHLSFADPSREMTFYLGTHHPHWLTSSRVPLFVSHSTLRKYVNTRSDRAPAGCCVWALDSGGFSELQTYGDWREHPDEFGGRVYRFMDDVGPMVFCAPQDWMCEPWLIEGGVHQRVVYKGTWTRKFGFARAVRLHQEMTVENYVYLADQFPHAPWMPVLQGWTLGDYLRCVDMYSEAKVDLASLPVVGLGSVCRRQSTAEIGVIVATLAGLGLKLHGFGVKLGGLQRYGHMLSSSDSMELRRPVRSCDGGPSSPALQQLPHLCPRVEKARCERLRLKAIHHRVFDDLAYAEEYLEGNPAVAAPPDELACTINWAHIGRDRGTQRRDPQDRDRGRYRRVQRTALFHPQRTPGWRGVSRLGAG